MGFGVEWCLLSPWPRHPELLVNILKNWLMFLPPYPHVHTSPLVVKAIVWLSPQITSLTFKLFFVKNYNYVGTIGEKSFLLSPIDPWESFPNIYNFPL